MHQPVVLTGGPNAGKTTLIRAFRQMGFPVICEKATEVILEGRYMPADNPVEFRRETLARQQAAEQGLADETRPVIIDRGAYDGRAYCKATGCAEPTFLSELQMGLYPLAFVFEPVPTWEEDGVRYEDMEFSQTIGPVIANVYRDAGARVVSVPFMPVEDRVNLVLSVMKECNYSLGG